MVGVGLVLLMPMSRGIVRLSIYCLPLWYCSFVYDAIYSGDSVARYPAFAPLGDIATDIDVGNGGKHLNACHSRIAPVFPLLCVCTRD